MLHGLTRPHVGPVLGPFEPGPKATHWTFDDGGREAFSYGRKGSGDCVTRAIAIATGKPYPEVYTDLHAEIKQSKLRKHHKSAPDAGVRKVIFRRYLESLGWEFIPTMGIGTGCKVHLRAEELPKGRIICSCSKHLVAVIDGIIHDTYDPTRGGTRCVYGYFRKVTP